MAGQRQCGRSGIVLALAIVIHAPVGLCSERATVYFIPLDESTYGSITSEMIKLSGWEVWRIADVGQTARLRKILTNGPTTNSFDSDSIRAAIYFTNITILLDKNCNARDRLQTRHISKSALLEFRGSLHAGQIQSNSY
jgi:hypothetical protein